MTKSQGNTPRGRVDKAAWSAAIQALGGNSPADMRLRGVLLLLGDQARGRGTVRVLPADLAHRLDCYPAQVLDALDRAHRLGWLRWCITFWDEGHGLAQIMVPCLPACTRTGG